MLFDNKKSQQIENSSDDIFIWAALTPVESKRCLRWFTARSPEEQSAILHVFQTTTLPELKKTNPTNPEDGFMQLTALLLAIRSCGFDVVRKRGYRVAGTKEFMQFDKLRNGILASVKNRKKAPLRQQVLAYWGEVRLLKNKGNGFLIISRYLMQAHKIKISSSYLSKLWLEIEE